MMMKFAAALLAAGILLPPLPQATAASPSAQTLLDALRKAMLERPRRFAQLRLHTVGDDRDRWLRGRAQEWDDLHGVRFTTAQNAGPLSGASGWDGKSRLEPRLRRPRHDRRRHGRARCRPSTKPISIICATSAPDAGGATVVYAGPREAMAGSPTTCSR